MTGSGVENIYGPAWLAVDAFDSSLIPKRFGHLARILLHYVRPDLSSTASANRFPSHQETANSKVIPLATLATTRRGGRMGFRLPPLNRCLTAVFFVWALSGPAKAASIEAPFTGFFLSGFGPLTNSYVGNTFTAIAGEAESLIFRLQGGSEPLNFRLLVTEFDTSGLFPFHPTAVLFESATLVKPLFPLFSVTEYTVDLGGLLLEEGRQYAWLLDAFVEPNVFSASVSTAIDQTNTYLGGHAVSSGPFQSGTRADHFASNWVLDEASDFSFTMTFAPVSVPEPPSCHLVGLGLACFLFVAGARRTVRQDNAKGPSGFGAG